jgi:predicted dehydrogenase
VSQQQSGPIRVGVVGANVSRGWGTSAHLPALAHLPEFEVVAVSTTRSESAAATAQQFGIAHAFSNNEELVQHPEVDLVAVTVKVPSHAPVIRAALAAGRHVFSEWPLGVDLDEADELSKLAHDAGVIHAVGLQGFYSADARYVGDLIAEGRIGELRSVSVVATGGPGGARLPLERLWATDRAAGVNILTITGGHVLSTVARALSRPPAALAAIVANLDPEATVIETGERVSVSSPNQVGLLGALDGGALLSITLQGGAPPAAAGFSIRIVGTDGALLVTPARAGTSMHIHDWAITLAPAVGQPERLSVPASYRTAPDEIPAGPARNVAGLYRELAAAISEGRPANTSFGTAVAYHRLLATIERAADARTVEPVNTAGLLPREINAVTAS